MSLHLAYDGSINGDWVARYAIGLAARAPERRLRVVHVETGEIPDDRLDENLDRIADACRPLRIEVRIDRLAPRGGVLATLIEAIPPAADTFVVCGVRNRGGRRGYLAGTVAEGLLGRRRLAVMVVRVVQPGVLGAPRDVLVAVPAPATTLGASLPFLRLMAPQIAHLHVHRGIGIGRSAYRRLTPRRLSRLRSEGRAHAEGIERTMIETAALEAARVDTGIRITDDWAADVIAYASRHKSQLICVEAPVPRPAGRLFRADAIERLLADAPCDVALFRGA